MGHNRRVGTGRSGWLGGLEADWLADEDDVNAAGQFLVDLEDLPDLAVLPVGGLRAGVFQRQAVADHQDPLTIPHPARSNLGPSIVWSRGSSKDSEERAMTTHREARGQ